MPHVPLLRKPAWLKRTLPTGPEYESIRRIVSHQKLNTVCEEAACPNRYECYGKGTATFMILGDRCTRNCRFCAVKQGSSDLDPHEPERVADAIRVMGLSYVVITSVTRDDLPDGGSNAFAKTVKAIRKINPGIRVEVLVPDFKGDKESISRVLDAKPDVFGHNIETVEPLYEKVRPEAIYQRSLDVLRHSKTIDPRIFTKSSIMLGLGETMEMVSQAFGDLADAGCNILSIGQYLSPSKNHLPVENYIPPETFDQLKEMALNAGLKQVASGPFVRSSYEAAGIYSALLSTL